jgi:hypothetical protein
MEGSPSSRPPPPPIPRPARSPSGERSASAEISFTIGQRFGEQDARIAALERELGDLRLAATRPRPLAALELQSPTPDNPSIRVIEKTVTKQPTRREVGWAVVALALIHVAEIVVTHFK